MTKMYIYKKILLLIISLCFFIGCALQGSHKPVMPNDSPWRVIEVGCGEGAGSYGIEKNNIQIGIISRTGSPKERVFTIALSLSFDKSIAHYKFDPSKSFVELNNGQVYSTKGLGPVPPHYQYSAKEAYRSAEAIKTPKQLKNWNEYFALFFDIEPPNKNESFKLRIEGLSKNGNNVKIPEIMFVQK